jgi:hypothetical protein
MHTLERPAFRQTLFEDERTQAKPPTPMQDMIDCFVTWAQLRPDVRAGVVLGSWARNDMPADDLSDLDLLVIVSDPSVFLSEGGAAKAASSLAPGDCSGWSQQSSKTGAAGGIQNALKTIEQELETGETLVELC